MHSRCGVHCYPAMLPHTLPFPSALLLQWKSALGESGFVFKAPMHRETFCERLRGDRLTDCSYAVWVLGFEKKKKCSRVCVSLVDRVCVVSHTYGNSILVWPLWLQVFLFRLWSELSIHYSFYSKRNILTLSVVYFSWSLPMDIATLLKWKWKLTFSWSMNCECIFIKVKLKTLNRVILVVCVLSVLCLVVYMVQQSHLVAFLDSAGFITATAPVVYLFFPLVSISVVLQQLSNITHA